MDDMNLYNSPYVANRIKEYAKIKKIPLKNLLDECGLGPNTFSHMLHGRSIAFDSLARIADCLDCSVDYLLGKTNVVAPQRVERSSDDDEFLDLFRNMSEEDRSEIVRIMLEKKNKK